MKNEKPLHIRPGKILTEELKSRNITAIDFAKLSGINLSELLQILDCKRDINSFYSHLIGKALSIDYSFWLGLQERFAACFSLLTN